MQITIRKQFLILVEISENIFRVFLIVINFVFEFFEEVVESFFDYAENKLKKVFNFIRSIFGFNIYRLNTKKIENNFSKNNNFVKQKNESFLRYSNLLSPPKR